MSQKSRLHRIAFPAYRPAVVPFVDILLAGLPDAPVRQQVCVRCDVVIRDGALPVQREFCAPCFAQVVA